MLSNALAKSVGLSAWMPSNPLGATGTAFGIGAVVAQTVGRGGAAGSASVSSPNRSTDSKVCVIGAGAERSGTTVRSITGGAGASAAEPGQQAAAACTESPR